MLNTSHPVRGRRHPGTGAAPLFSFVVVADTHVNEADGESTSPCVTNRFANDRARHVFDDIAAMDPPPSFVVHLGDIVHPVPSLPTFAQAVERFKAIAAPLQVPLHVVPGNHDVGDKRIDWMPADQVCDDYLAIYRAAFGADFHAFDQDGARFVFLNSLLLNSGLPDEERQRDWLQKQIATAAGRRVFLFMHYPPYVHTPDERGSYDNIDEPARGWLLAQIARPGVEAVFAGHVHNFWYDRIAQADFYMLPSTAFLRHDLTEFYRIAPAVEFGRGDAEKFGYFVVDVHRDGHVAYAVRTHGRQLAADAAGAAGGASAARASAPTWLTHPAVSTFERIGVELRHPWAESMQIAATGGVQEFGRKWARNDYPMLALWEMGARLAKIPDIDVADDAVRRRMALLARFGQRFLVTSLGRPPASVTRAVAAACGIVGVELNASWPTVERQREAIRGWREASGVALFLSKIHGFDDSHFDGKHFNHFVKAGFVADALAREAEAIRAAAADGLIDGITVRIEAEEPLLDIGPRLQAFAQAHGLLVLASLKTSGPNLASERADDRAMVLRTAQAMLLSKATDRVRYVFDTFMDVDRGYYPRHGFIDRRFDPRPAARAFATLNVLLSHEASLALVPEPTAFTALTVRGTGVHGTLLSGGGPQLRQALQSLPGDVAVLDLVDGVRRSRDETVEALTRAPAGLCQVLFACTD